MQFKSLIKTLPNIYDGERKVMIDVWYGPNKPLQFSWVLRSFIPLIIFQVFKVFIKLFLNTRNTFRAFLLNFRNSLKVVKNVNVRAEYLKTRDICFSYITLFFYKRYLLLILSVNGATADLVIRHWPKKTESTLKARNNQTNFLFNNRNML